MREACLITWLAILLADKADAASNGQSCQVADLRAALESPSTAAYAAAPSRADKLVSTLRQQRRNLKRCLLRGHVDRPRVANQPWGRRPVPCDRGLTDSARHTSSPQSSHLATSAAGDTSWPRCSGDRKGVHAQVASGDENAEAD